jgi:hypothetical protein
MHTFASTSISSMHCIFFFFFHLDHIESDFPLLMYALVLHFYFGLFCLLLRKKIVKILAGKENRKATLSNQNSHFSKFGEKSSMPRA